MTLYMCDVVVKNADGTITEHRNTYWKLSGPFGDVNLDKLVGGSITLTRSESQVGCELGTSGGS